MTDQDYIKHEPMVVIPWWMDCRPWDVFPPKGYESSEIRIRNLKIIESGKYGVRLEHQSKDDE